jgi:hypothetical protein
MNVREHGNADNLVLATCFENTVCVAKDKYFEGQLGVYFPVDGQLSMEFCEKNGLLAVYDEFGKNISGGYLDASKRNIRAIKLRGEQSDGLFLPIECLAYTGVDLKSLTPGTPITVVNDHDICKKYIPRKKNGKPSRVPAGQKLKKKNSTPTFFEHKDTEQLDYNLSAFKPGDEIEITLKIHGTSQRTANVPVLQENRFSLADNEFKSILIKLMPKGKWKDRLIEKWCNPVYDYSTISGTRRTVMDTFEGGFYGSNEFREQYHEFFKDKLWKGETVYYEVAGFTHTGQPIMATVSNKGVNDKNFVKMYGNTTTFSYGCDPNGTRPNVAEGCVVGCPDKPQSRMWVYRMTMTNPDGQVVEYTPDFMRYRCEQMAVDCVPLLWKGIIPEHPASKDDDTISAGEWIANKADMYNDGPDPIDPRHVREGVVVRILNRPTFTAYKSKNHNFKVIEGIAKEVADAPDMEEADGIEDCESC